MQPFHIGWFDKVIGVYNEPESEFFLGDNGWCHKVLNNVYFPHFVALRSLQCYNTHILQPAKVSQSTEDVFASISFDREQLHLLAWCMVIVWRYCSNRDGLRWQTWARFKYLNVSQPEPLIRNAESGTSILWVTSAVTCVSSVCWHVARLGWYERFAQNEYIVQCMYCYTGITTTAVGLWIIILLLSHNFFNLHRHNWFSSNCLPWYRRLGQSTM